MNSIWMRKSDIEYVSQHGLGVCNCSRSDDLADGVGYVLKAIADDVLKENMVLQKRLDKLENKLDIAEAEYLRQYSKGWDDGAKDAIKDIKVIHEKYKDRDLENILPIVDELWQAIATTVRNVREVE
jgi:hypothetical protein